MILITGGAGFIGSHLTERLMAQGKEVTILDNFNEYYNPSFKHANIEKAQNSSLFRLVKGDVCNRELCENLFKEIKPKVVVHLAAMVGVRPSLDDPLIYEKVNCFGTLSLLQLAVKFGASRFVFASSSSVYGGNDVPFREENVSEFPYSPYAATKRAGELFCANFHYLYKLPIAVLRFFTVYGPRQRPDMAIHKFARLIDTQAEVPIFGDGSSSRDYTYVDDIVDGIVASLEVPLSFEILNLGNSHPTTLLYLIKLLEENIGRKAQIRYKGLQPGDVPHTCASIEKSQRILGYNPKFPIEEGIARFVAWFKERKR